MKSLEINNILESLELNKYEIGEVITRLGSDVKNDVDIVIDERKKQIIEQMKNSPGSIKTFFMPIINNKTNNIEKFEALVRVQMGDEIILPYEFIHLIENDSQLNHIMTKQMVVNVIETLERIPNIKIALNFNKKNLEDKELFNLMNGLIKSKKIETSRLRIEILETIECEGNELKERIKELKNNDLTFQLMMLELVIQI